MRRAHEDHPAPPRARQNKSDLMGSLIVKASTFLPRPFFAFSTPFYTLYYKVNKQNVATKNIHTDSQRMLTWNKGQYYLQTQKRLSQKSIFKISIFKNKKSLK